MSRTEIPPLYPIVDADSPDEALALIERLLDCEPPSPLFQIRAKQLEDRCLLALLRKIVQQRNKHANTTSVSTKIIVNDRIDLCLLSQADGVHLGADDIAVAAARELLGAKAIIGKSTHSLVEVKRANNEDVDYIGFGPIFPSPSKSGHAPVLGLELLHQAVLASKFPVIAIGGITLARTGNVFQTGTQSVATISDLKQANDIKSYFAAFLSARSSFTSNATASSSSESSSRLG